MNPICLCVFTHICVTAHTKYPCNGHLSGGTFNVGCFMASVRLSKGFASSLQALKKCVYLWNFKIYQNLHIVSPHSLFQGWFFPKDSRMDTPTHAMESEHVGCWQGQVSRSCLWRMSSTTLATLVVSMALVSDIFTNDTPIWVLFTRVSTKY